MTPKIKSDGPYKDDLTLNYYYWQSLHFLRRLRNIVQNIDLASIPVRNFSSKVSEHAFKTPRTPQIKASLAQQFGQTQGSLAVAMIHLPPEGPAALMREHLYTQLLPTIHNNLNDAQSEILIRAYHSNRVIEAQLVAWIAANGGSKRLVGMQLHDTYQACDIDFGVEPKFIECLKADEQAQKFAEKTWISLWSDRTREDYKEGDDYKCYVAYEGKAEDWL